MTVTYANGTARQRAWFQETVRQLQFPLSRITTQVTVTWVEDLGLTVGHHREHPFAVTTALSVFDLCGHPDAAAIQIRSDLDDPNRPGNESGRPRGWYAGKRFYMESVAHELGHVVQAKFSAEQIAAMSALFGGTPAQWDSDDLAWAELRQESDAETFKDVWLPKPYRKFTNRTAHRLTEPEFDRYLDILDHVCPCTATDPGEST